MNLQAILTGKVTNVLFQPADIVWILKRPLGQLEAAVQLVFQYSACTVTFGEGSRVAGGTQDPDISILLSSPP